MASPIAQDERSYGIPGPAFGPRTWTTPVSGPRPCRHDVAVSHPRRGRDASQVGVRGRESRSSLTDGEHRHLGTR